MRNLKKKLAWGGAVSGGATGLSIGSNPALMAATGGWSPLIGAGVGAIAGTITEDKRIAEQRKLDEDAKKKLDALSLKQNNIYNQDFPFKGTTGAEIYKYGGKLKKQFGNGGLMPISQDASKVVGPTHEEGGVDLNSQEEVEKDEVIVGDKVFSKRLGFADIAMKIINTPQYKEFENEKNQNEMVLKNLKSGMSSKGTAKRNIEKLGVNPLDVLFEQQTKFAQENNIPQNGEMAYGGQLKKKYGNGNSYTNDEIDPMTGLPYSNTRPDYAPLNPTRTQGMFDVPQSWNHNSLITPKSPIVKLPNENSTYNRVSEPLVDKGINLNTTNKVNTFGQNSNEMFANIDNTTSTNNLKSPNKFNAADFAPLLDNVVNYALTKNTPKIPNQALTTPRALETKYDITANLNELNTDFNNFNKNIDRTTTDVGMANANKQQAFTNLIKGKNVLYGNKINQEVAMRNANKKLQLDIETQNNSIDYNNKFKQSMREGDIQDRYSKNAENLTKDLTQFKIDQKLEANDTATLEMYYKVYNKYGTLDRNFSDTELKTIGFTDEQITRFRKGK